ncbi:DUF1622 domain-containing protein [Entomospira culicis]|uniref:DUF1622 domain-containing protein n=1 Tax=Entomospira culicis TaxID=2719989 RepID=A0A968GGJ9_9SPIO|nr:DUF1622 domain-containing protein [Entomospira culicis]NIZ19884.1 DUF1622 domain-containing protein [Entomospira culicis]NIZ70098.1 DUF1622 domain-containing protein [Entomospira culicis]WDI37202.1 DUF1622 domain-containing protein [Entomospira culicis]WDI38831.1 DUF1622 domain-containing protein [Entomospira culicis]
MIYEHILDISTYAMNAVSVIILIYGVFRSGLRLIHIEFKKLKLSHKMAERQKVRAYLGSYILLSLEFLIAADIIATIAHPSSQEIIILAAVILMRTFISYFLGKEIEQAMHFEQKEEIE